MTDTSGKNFKDMTLDDFLKEECLHCAISLFIFRWRHYKPDDEERGDLAMVVAKLLECTADAIGSVPEDDDRKMVCKLSADRFLADINDIMNGVYGQGQQPSREDAEEPRKH